MRKFITLLKTSLNVHFGISFLKYRFTKEKKRLWEPIAIFAAVVFGGGSLVTMYSFLLLGIFIGGQVINQPEIVLTFSFMVSQMVILIFGIFYIMSVFYFSQDMEILVPLPLKPGRILGVKFVTILISEYLVTLPMLLPALFIYGIELSPGPFYWFKGFVLMLTAPILPLAIAGIFVVILMRFVNIRKSKDLMVVIGSLFGLLAGLGINFLTQNIPEGNEEEFIKHLVEKNEGLIRAVGAKFPPSIWATLGLSKSGWQGWGYFLIFVGFSLILVFLLIWLGNRFFYRGFLAGQEVRRKNRTITGKEIEKHFNKVSNPIISLFWKEWRLFFRTPIYVMNGLAGVIMIPLIMMMPLITRSEELIELINYARNPEYITITMLISLGIILFATSLNMVSCTSISREGSTFWISKIIPIPPRDQVLAKLLHSASLSLLSIILIIIPLYFVLNIALYRLVIIIILGFLTNGLINVLGLAIDLVRPKLEWSNPQEAIKQNFNVLWGMLISLLVIGILGGLSAVLILNNLSELWIYGILAVLVIMMLVPALYGLFKFSRIRYQNLEV
ncbi:MAG TPA: hypothetical protein VFC96_00580 [Anaerovoracaceae bacterium]|nr:hypothetical protein [Anaerovoracaceae bacterium]